MVASLLCTVAKPLHLIVGVKIENNRADEQSEETSHGHRDMHATRCLSSFRTQTHLVCGCPADFFVPAGTGDIAASVVVDSS